MNFLPESVHAYVETRTKAEAWQRALLHTQSTEPTTWMKVAASEYTGAHHPTIGRTIIGAVCDSSVRFATRRGGGQEQGVRASAGRGEIKRHALNK